MGWFAIACICGFLGYRVRPILSDWLTRSCRTTTDNANFLSVLVGFIIVFVVLVLWAILSEGARTFDQFSDALNRGQVARFLFGLVLGSGAALVLAERSSGQTGTGVATAATTEKSANPASDRSKSATENDASLDGSAGGLRPHFILSTALGITLLALAGPHVDSWLSHLTGFKSPLVELQVASTSTHKVSVVEGSETLFNIDSIEYLITYVERLAHDIDYITNYGQQMSEQKDILASANRILPGFRDVLKPVASCIKSAMAEDWLSIDQARQMVKPTAGLGEQIIFGEGALSKAELIDRNQKFWNGLVGLPGQIRSLVNTKDCTTPTLTEFPSFQNNKNVPYLYVTAALLSSFLADDDKALRILQKAKDSNLIIKDYFFLYMIARLFYYTGKPGDIADSYFGPLNEMYSTARSRIDSLQRANQKCVKEVDLLCREQKAEVIAIDAITYYIAEDLARGSKDVTSYVARLKEYAGELKRITDEAGNHTSSSNDYYTYVRGEKYRYLDTYAYAVLILEAQKSNPDYDLIRRKVVGSLEEVVENVSAKDARSAKIDRANLAQLRIFQAHLASAKSLVGE